MSTLRGDAPLIVAAQLDPVSFATLDALRQRHFPTSLNKVPAHVSLFHHLPGDAVETVVADATRICAGVEPFDLRPTGFRFLGRGVAIDYEGADLRRLRAALASDWAIWLTAQDRQPFKPHVTIQNKVTPDAARRLFESLSEEVAPTCRVEGIAIWRYLGGHWEPVAVIPFRAVN